MMIKQLKCNHDDLTYINTLNFAIIKDQFRTFRKGITFTDRRDYLSRDTYLEANNEYYTEFTFINKGENDERS